jgi:hypothetical protein
MINAVWYSFLFIGIIGFAAQLLLGAHFGHNASHTTHVAAPHHHADAAHGHNDAHQHLASAKHTPEGKASENAARMGLLISVLSPMTIFSICLGTGATGLLLGHLHLEAAIDIVLAATGGIMFYALISRPLMTFLLKFESEPSKALDGSVAEPAEAISHFDSSGKGLVNLTVDGQIVRVLATLERK